MMILRTLLAAAALSLATPASAQEGPNQAAAARAMIEQHSAGDLFEAVDDDSVTVRHRASGLTCHFFPEEDSTTRLHIFTSQLPRGEDVGCYSENEGRAVTVYATRYAPPISAEQSLAEAVAAIRQRFNDARPTPTALSMSSEGFPQTHAGHFLITLHNEQWLTSALVARNGDWIIKVRYTARAATDDAVMGEQLEANAIMMLAHLEMRD